MFTGIIEARRKVQAVDPGGVNTFIGGVASIMYDKQSFADVLGVDVANVTYFKAIGDDVEATIDVMYIPKSSTFQDYQYRPGYKGYGDIVTYFIDKGKVSELPGNMFTQQANFKYAEFPAATYCKIQNFEDANLDAVKLHELIELESLATFQNNYNLRLVYLPKMIFCSSHGAVNLFGGASAVYIPQCLELGENHLHNGVFNQCAIGVEIWAHPDMQTINNGGEEGDLAWARANKDAIIYYGVDPEIVTPPDVITNLSISCTSTTTETFTPPASLHEIELYKLKIKRVDLNGVFIEKLPDIILSGSGEQIENFTLGMYVVEILAYDKYFNESESSNLVELNIFVDPVVDLSSDAAYGNSVHLFFTTPPAQYNIQKYDVYVDSLFHATISSSGDRVIDLPSEQWIEIDIVAIDAAGNRSDFSNKISILTDGDLQPNTFIGGVSHLVPDTNTLASVMHLNLNDILSFEHRGDEVAFRFEGYNVIDGGSPSPFRNELGVVTYFLDKGGNFSIENATIFYYTDNMREAFFPTTLKVGNGALISRNAYEVIYIPEALELGNSPGTDNNAIHGAKEGTKVYLNPYLQTSNNGVEEADVAGARSRGAQIIYVQNNENPPPPDNLHIYNSFASTAELRFDEPVHTNEIDHYEIYIDGVLKEKFQSTKGVIFNLEIGLSYDIQVISIDKYYNKSDLSTVFSYTHAFDAGIPQNGIVSYFPLDAKAGAKAYDLANGNDGDMFNGVIETSGKIAQSFSFDGSSDVIKFPTFESITDGDFTVSFWVKQGGQNLSAAFSQGIPANWPNQLFMFYIGESSPNDNEVRVFWSGTTALRYIGDGGVASTEFRHYVLRKTGVLLELFKNNVMVASSNTNTDVWTSTSQSIGAGNNNGTMTQFYKGDLDELGTWKVALTDAEISELYNSELGKSINRQSGVIGTVSDLLNTEVTANRAKFTATIPSSDYTLSHYDVFLNGVLHKGTTATSLFTVYGLMELTTYNVQVAGVDKQGNIGALSNTITITTPEKTIPTTGLVAYYNLESLTGHIVDVHAGNNGVNAGSTRGVTGKQGACLSMDGTSDYVDLGDNTNLNIIGDLSISVWIKLDSLSESRAITTWANDSYSSFPFHLVIIPSGRIRFNNDSFQVDSISSLSVNTWYNITVTRIGDVGKVYINGDLDQTVTGIPQVRSGDTFCAISRSDSQKFSGLIDELGFWNRELNQAEVTNMYNNGDGVTY